MKEFLKGILFAAWPRRERSGLLTRLRDRIQFAKAILPWGEARARECIRQILDRARHEAPGQKGLGPEGCGAFGRWLRCASGYRAPGYAPLRTPRHRPKSPQQTAFYPGVSSVWLAALGAALVCLGPGVMAQGAAGAPRLSPGFAALPLAFEPLDGQREFLARGPNYQVRIAPGQAELVLARTAAAQGTPLTDRARSVASPLTTTRALRLEFAGANPRARTCADGRMPGKMNYLVGSDPARWRTGLAMYAQVRVEELYPGVSLVYYGNQQRLEYRFQRGARGGCGRNRDAFRGGGSAHAR